MKRPNWIECQKIKEMLSKEAKQQIADTLKINIQVVHGVLNGFRWPSTGEDIINEAKKIIKKNAENLAKSE